MMGATFRLTIVPAVRLRSSPALRDPAVWVIAPAALRVIPPPTPPKAVAVRFPPVAPGPRRMSPLKVVIERLPSAGPPPAPAETRPTTLSVWLLVSAKSAPDPLVENVPSVPIRLEPARLAGPAAVPVSVPVVMIPAVWLIAPAETRSTVPAEAIRLPDRVSDEPPVVVRSRVFPVPASTRPVTVSAAPSVIETVPTPVLTNPPRVANRLAPVRLAPPADEPLRLPVVMKPDDWLRTPAETRSTAPPGAIRAPARVRGPPLVVVRVRVFAPASTEALMVRPLALASVIEMLPTPPLVKPGRVSNRLPSVRLVAPTDEPVSAAVVMIPVVWVSAPAETRSTVPPASVRLAPRVKGPAVVVRVRMLPPVPALTAPVTVRPVTWASVTEKPPGPVLVKPARVSKRFASVRLALPAAEPVSVPVVMTPDVWLSEPVVTRSTVPPAALRSAPSERPPVLAVKVSALPGPASTAPVTFKEPLADVMLTPPAPVLMRPPRLVNRLAWASVVPPTDEPVTVVAVMIPVAVWPIVPSDVRVRVWPVAFTGPCREMFPPGVVVEKVVAPRSAVVGPTVRPVAPWSIRVPPAAFSATALVSSAPELVTARLPTAVSGVARVRPARAVTVKFRPGSAARTGPTNDAAATW